MTPCVSLLVGPAPIKKSKESAAAAAAANQIQTLELFSPGYIFDALASRAPKLAER